MTIGFVGSGMPSSPADSSMMQDVSARSIPSDPEINMEDLLFDAKFARAHNESYRNSLDDTKLKEEWERNGISMGYWGSPVFDVRFYLDHHPFLRQKIGATNLVEAKNYFLQHYEDHVQTSSIFNWTVYNKQQHLVHLTPKQLFWYFYHVGFSEQTRAV